MSTDKLQLQVVCSFGRVVDAPCDEVVVPGERGEFGVLPGHVPFLSGIEGGVVRYRDAQGLHAVSVSSGFAEVHADHVLVLVTTAERADQIDVERARAALAGFEKDHATLGEAAPVDDPALLRLGRRIRRERARLEAAETIH